MGRQNTSRQRNQELFDRNAPHYQSVLNRALAPSGEASDYFARARVEWLQRQLHGLAFAPSSVLDYGCGIGGSVPFLKEILNPRRILGVDISSESLHQARQEHDEKGVEFANCDHYFAHSEFHLAFCNGVFHHIAPAERASALRYVHDSLLPGGIFALWENNPYNPATRYLMGQCEFDDEAISITCKEAKKLLASNGFVVLHSSSYFYFPRWLKWLRGLEPTLSHLPLGAQYLVLARKCG
jgi:SAM-dependent methyltransferase